MKGVSIFLIFLAIGLGGLKKPASPSRPVATTDSTIMSGNYSNSAIWSNGTVPNGGNKNIVISNQTFVVLDANISVNTVLIRQSGNIIFGTNKFLNNICLNYEPDSIIENNNKTALYSSLIMTCTDSYPPPNYAKRTSCSNTGWNDSTVVTDKTKMSGCWSNPKTFNTNSIPNSNTKQVYAKEFFTLKIDTSVVVKRFVSRRATVRWIKGASINGISHQNYRIY